MNVYMNNLQMSNIHYRKEHDKPPKCIHKCLV